MGLAVLVLRYIGRSPLRAILTVVAVALSLLAFLLLRTVGRAWTEQVEQTPNDRVVTRHKLGFSKELPAHYAQVIRGLPGVESAVGVRWAGLKLPSAPKTYFDSFTVEGPEFVEMHDEVSAPAHEKRAFLENRRGAMVSQKLAQEFHWKVGDKVYFESVFPVGFELTISTIFKSTRYGFADRMVWFHAEYFNQSIPVAERDRVSLIAAKIREPSQGALIAKAIDIHFDDKDDRTFSQEDKALNASMTGRYAAILRAVNLVSALVLVVVLLILGNTVAMSARERTLEYATIRAIGFRPGHVLGLVLGEAGLMGLLGGALALPLSYPLIEHGASRYFEETLFIPPLEVPLTSALGTLGMGLLLGLLSASIPALRTARVGVVRALRVVG